MAKKDVIEAEGKVIEAQPNAMFIVELETGHKVLAHVSGKIRNKILSISRNRAEIRDRTYLKLLLYYQRV